MSVALQGDGTTDALVGRVLDGQHLTRFHISLLSVSFLTMFTEGYDMQALAYAAPLLLNEWQIDKASLGPVFGAGLFGYMLGATWLTGFADRFGRKSVIVAGTMLYGIFTLLAAFVGTVEALLMLRFAAGVGLGVSVPTIMTLNAEFAPPRVRNARLTLLFVGYALGGSLGGVIAARAMSTFGWEAAFYIGGLFPMALSVILVFVLPESMRFLAGQNGDANKLGALLARMRPDMRFSRDEIDSLRRTETTQPAGLPLRLLFSHQRAPVTVLLWFAFVTSLLGHHFLTNWLPTMLADEGIDFESAVMIGGLILGGSIFGGPLLGMLMDRLGIKAVIMWYLLSVPFVAAIGLAGGSIPMLVLLIFLAGVTLIGGQFGLNALAPSLYPTAIRSSGIGWALGIGRLGAIIGPVAGGFLLSMQVSSATLFVLAAIPALCCAAALYLLLRRQDSTTVPSH